MLTFGMFSMHVFACCAALLLNWLLQTVHSLYTCTFLGKLLHAVLWCGHLMESKGVYEAMQKNLHLAANCELTVCNNIT